MKKARIILSALAIFAVVGGVLASKAKSQFTLFVNDGGVCTSVLTGATTDPNVDPLSHVLVNASANTISNSTGACDQFDQYYTNVE